MSGRARYENENPKPVSNTSLIHARKGKSKMVKVEGSSSNKSKRMGTFTLALSVVAAFVAPGLSYGAKPPPPLQSLTALNATVCKGLYGTWTSTTTTCAISVPSALTFSIRVPSGVTLDIKSTTSDSGQSDGSLTIPTGMTLANAGTIIVENAGGVPTEFDADIYKAGILVLGTLDNSGAITIQNVADNTEGITISVTATENPNDPSVPDPYTVVGGTLANSGTITIQNQANTRGIKNLGALVNSASGTIKVQNSLTTSVGIYNRRDNHLNPGYYYVDGTMTNAGSIQISNSGKNVNGQFGYGIYNGGLITIAATGTFAINASSGTPETDDAGGFYNSGSFTNYGTLINNRGNLTDPQAQVGSFNNEGTMINYGTTYAGSENAPCTGIFVNWEGGSIMVNLGKIINWGGLGDISSSTTMINHGTIYNYGGISGGKNRGVCIDEYLVNPSAGDCYSSGD